jgi:ParB-like chromosome segregation protein Spo0J
MEKRKLEDLVPYDKNPRKNDGAVDKVLESLMRHGQVKPLVVSEKGKPFEKEVVCAGHTTLRALERFGAKDAFVVVKAFADEAQFVDYNIRDNKTSEFAAWDEAVLADLASEFEIDLGEMDFQLSDDAFEENDDELGLTPEDKLEKYLEGDTKIIRLAYTQGELERVISALDVLVGENGGDYSSVVANLLGVEVEENTTEET